MPDGKESNRAVPSAVHDFSVAFVGSVVADTPRRQTKAFSRAGNMSQIGLLRGLELAGVDLTVLSFAPEPAFPRSKRVWVSSGVDEVAPGVCARLLGYINVIPLKQLAIGLQVLIALCLWGWRSRSAKRRVVLAYNLTMPPGIFTLLGARLARAKAVVSINDIHVPGQTVPDSFRFRTDFAVQRAIIRSFDGLIAVSDAIARDFAPSIPYLRIDGGVMREVLDETGAAADDRRGSPFTVVAAGRLDATNGFDIMLEAFARISAPRMRFVVAGAGPLEGAVRAAAARDCRIDFRGWLPLAQVLAAYREADLLLNIRQTRAVDTRYFFPSKMMEFLASGVPVVTTDTGHVRQEYGEYVYLLDDENPGSLASLIEEVAATPVSVRCERARRGREYMAREKTWEAQAQRALAFIRRNVFRDAP